MNYPLTVLIVEDHWTVRKSMHEYLEENLITVHQADSHNDALSQFAEIGDSVDVAVIDIVLPRESGGRASGRHSLGVETARQLLAANPNLGIVFYSSYEDRRAEVFELDGEGTGSIVYLHKGSKPQDLLDAIHKSARNLTGFEIAFTPELREPDAFELAQSTLTDEEQAFILPALDLIPKLTESEWAVLKTVGACRSNHSAATEISLAHRTIDSHRSSIYIKLNLRNCELNQSALLAKIYLLHQLRQLIRSH